MTEHVASRTLVKSPPELWAECSDAASLARHLDQFGDIKITRLDPETAVAWEGERARGTVRIEPAGWGTKVILTAVAVEEEPDETPAVLEVIEVAEVSQTGEVPEAVEEPEAVEQPEAVEGATDSPPRRRRFPRLFRFRRAPMAIEPIAEPEPEATAEPEPDATAEPEPDATAEPEPEPERTPDPEPTPDPTLDETSPETTEAALTAALESLGQAHHRPYSRA